MIGLWLWTAVASGTTFTVDTTVDNVAPFDGLTSLREALLNAGPGDDIDFAFPSRQTIVLDAALGTLPAVDGADLHGDQLATLDGSALGAATWMLPVEDGAIVRGVELRDAADEACLEVLGDDVTIGGTGALDEVHLSGCAGPGVHVSGGASATTLRQVTVGLDSGGALAGTCVAPSGPCGGVFLESLLHDHLVEETIVVGTLGDPASFQGSGILVLEDSDDVDIRNNWIGTTPSGGQPGYGNAGTGIAAFTDPGGLLERLQVTDNIVLGSGKSGIYIGAHADGATIERNQIGLDVDGTTVVGVGTTGIRVFASDDHRIADNVVVDSGRHGIHLSGAYGGDWQSDSVIEGNLLGVYDDGGTWVAAGNGRYGLLSEGQGGRHRIVDNVSANNTLSGMVLTDSNHVVQGNIVGVSPDGTTAMGNGGAGIWIGGDDTKLGGGVSWDQLPTLGEMNLVSANASHGIGLSSGSSEVFVWGNLIGTDGTGSGASVGFGNGGAGIYVRDGGGHELGRQHHGNVLVNNDVGLDMSHDTGTAVGHLVSFNRVGIDALGSVVGNLGDGLFLHGDVDDTRVEANEVAGNQGIGILLDDTTAVALSQNAVHDNTACGIRLLNGANWTAGVGLVPAQLTAGQPRCVVTTSW